MLPLRKDIEEWEEAVAADEVDLVCLRGPMLWSLVGVPGVVAGGSLSDGQTIASLGLVLIFSRPLVSLATDSLFFFRVFLSFSLSPDEDALDLTLNHPSLSASNSSARAFSPFSRLPEGGEGPE